VAAFERTLLFHIQMYRMNVFLQIALSVWSAELCRAATAMRPLSFTWFVWEIGLSWRHNLRSSIHIGGLSKCPVRGWESISQSQIMQLYIYLTTEQDGTEDDWAAVNCTIWSFVETNIVAAVKPTEGSEVLNLAGDGLRGFCDLPSSSAHLVSIYCWSYWTW